MSESESSAPSHAEYLASLAPDHDLRGAGVVLTAFRLGLVQTHNAHPSLRFERAVAAQTARRQAARDKWAGSGRVRWYRYLKGWSWEKPISPTWAASALADARRRWGENEWARVQREATR